MSEKYQEKNWLHLFCVWKGMEYQFETVSQSVSRASAGFQCLMEKVIGEYK